MTPQEFDAALAELGWRAVDFTRRTELVPNTAWRWRKGITPIPAWVREYLGAMLEIKRLHERFVAVLRPAGGGAEAAGDAPDFESGASRNHNPGVTSEGASGALTG